MTAIGEVLNYAFDPANARQARAGFFQRVHGALVPGGVFLFDVAGPERAPSGTTQWTYATGPDWVVLMETSVDPGTAVLTGMITSFRQVGTLYGRDDEVHRLVLMEPRAVLESLRDAGFAVRSIPRYHAVPLPAGVVAFLGRKL